MILFGSALQLGISLVVGLMGSLVWLVLDRSKKIGRAFSIGVLVGVGTFGSLVGLKMIPARPVAVTIDSPSPGTIISGPETIVSGTVSPPDARVFVLVHPRDSNRWWAQVNPQISRKEPESDWETTVYLGTETLGRGEAFEVIAVASQDLLLFDILTGRYYQTGDEIDSLPPLSRSSLLTLFREP